MPKNYCMTLVIIEDFLAYFGTCKIGLVPRIEYQRNIQTLIYKSDFSIWQHDLEIHDGITIQLGSDTN